MSKMQSDAFLVRRSLLARVGAAAGVLGAAISLPSRSARAAEGEQWRPARHAEDDWLDEIPGVHRLAFDTTVTESVPLTFRFAENYFAVNRNSYGLQESDLAVVIVVRHQATSFGFNDAMWRKYGQHLADHAQYHDAKSTQAPVTNPYGKQAFQLMNKLGARFAVCHMATMGIAGEIASATGANSQAITSELSANLLGNGRIVPAGIVAVNRAQERGYSLVTPV